MEESGLKKENKEKKKFLNRFWMLEQEQKDIEKEIEQLRIDRICPSREIDSMPHGSRIRAGLEDYAAEIDDLLQELYRILIDKIKKRREITKAIDQLEKEEQRMVLRLRYIHNMEWDDICTEIRYEKTRTFEIHGDALKNLQIQKSAE